MTALNVFLRFLQSAKMVKKFGPFVGYLYAINTVIGAGFLSLPWAYDESGWLFCLLIQVLYALMNLILSF